MRNPLRNAGGELLDSTFHPGNAGREEILVIGHGVTANKDRPFLLSLAEAAAAAGVDALRVSFAGNGASEGRFEDATVTKEVADLRAVLDALEGRRAIYAGHSMGAAVGVLAAAEDDRIRGLVSLAGMVHTQAFAERKFGELVPGRDLMWDKPGCPLSQAFVDDMARVGSVLERAVDVRVPWLLVHGTADTVVPFAESAEILERAHPPKHLIAIDGADHVFSEGTGTLMAAKVVAWLRARGFAPAEGGQA